MAIVASVILALIYGAVGQFIGYLFTTVWNFAAAPFNILAASSFQKKNYALTGVGVVLATIVVVVGFYLWGAFVVQFGKGFMAHNPNIITWIMWIGFFVACNAPVSLIVKEYRTQTVEERRDTTRQIGGLSYDIGLILHLPAFWLLAYIPGFSNWMTAWIPFAYHG